VMYLKISELRAHKYELPQRQRFNLEDEHRMGGFVGCLSMKLDNERVYHLSCVKEIFSRMFHG
jgi:hypothetical protein